MPLHPVRTTANTAAEHVADHNAYRAEFDAPTHTHPNEIPATWTAYTPTLTQSGAVTKTIAYAKYTQMGKTVIAQGYLTVTGTGTAATIVLVGLPVAASGAGNHVMGIGSIFDSSASLQYKAIAVIQAATTTIGFLPTHTTGAFDTLGNNVFTAALAAGDIVAFNVTYEAA